MADEKEQSTKLIRPKVSGAWKMPNVGLNDVVDLMDFFGFEVEIKIIPKRSFEETL